MNEVVIEREFSQAPETVFAFISQAKNIVKWWGPEGVQIIDDYKLELSKLGPWGSTMVNDEGQRYKVTGEVIDVDPPHSIKFTWGWHDDKDDRGHESIVQFRVEPLPNGGTRFSLIHKGFADEESAQNHMGGWTSSLRRLETLIN